MKKRLLSLALVLVLLAALAPVSAFAADSPIFDRWFRYSVTIDPPEKGGTIHSVLYELNYEYGPIYRFSYNTLATTISTYTWYDENGQIIAENSGLTVEDPSQMLGKSYRLEIQALPYPIAAQATQSTPGMNYFYTTVETEYRGSSIKRNWQNNIGGYNNDGLDDLNYPSFRHYIYKGEHFFKFEYTFDPVCLPVAKTHDIAVTAPEPGQPLDFSAVIDNAEELTVKDTGDNFHLHGVRWTDKTDGVAVSGGTFKAGHTYELSVYLEPANEFYYFDAESLTGATVNGAPAQAMELTVGDQPFYEITCSFSLAPETCTVSFDAGGGAGTMADVTVAKGGKLTLPACAFTAPEGKTFDKWDVAEPGTEIEVTGDLTVRALWMDKPAEHCAINFDGNGGSGTQAAATVVKGETYTLPACTLAAPDGKEFDRWDLGAPGDEIEIGADTTIRAVWKDKVPEKKANPFQDIAETDYFYDAVIWAYYADPQVTNGMSTDEFGPESTVTRGQAVTFLWRAMGKPEPTTTENPFADVSEDAYYYKAVLWAVEKGITNGTDATHFTPGQTCSTAHILTFLYRTITGQPNAGWYETAAGWAQGAGLMGDLEITVSPEVNCPRADVVYFLYRALAK